MVVSSKPRRYWHVKENCAAEAKKHNRRCDFKTACPAGYANARKRGWLDEVCSHMISAFEAKSRSQLKWDKDACFALGRNCKNRYEMKRKSSSAYASARKNGWLEEIFGTLL